MKGGGGKKENIFIFELGMRKWKRKTQNQWEMFWVFSGTLDSWQEMAEPEHPN